MDNKRIIAAASFEKQKYYMEEAFSGLPESIKDEIRTVCVVLAQKLSCTFVMGFNAKNGDVYFETVKGADQIDFDDIGAELEIKRLYSEKGELIKALKLWYMIFILEEGEEIRRELLNKDKKDY